jgi:hypothetical protein
MNKLLQSTSMFPIALTILGVGFALPALAEKPSLSDGILCIAGKRGGFYFTTSAISDTSISQKQPVSVTVLQRQDAVGVSDLVIYDRTKQSLTFADLESVRVYTPEATPVGSGTVTYTGNHTFTGKTSTGAPLRLALSKNNNTLTLTHAGKTYKGVCR